MDGLRRLWSVVLVLLLISLLVPIPYQPYIIPEITNSQSVQPFIPSGRYIVPITIHTSLSQPVYNYSLEIVLNSTNFNGWDYLNASNIYFLDSNGQPLYYWVQELNTTSKEAVIWVNVTLTNQTIYMLYGGYNPYPEYNNASRVFLFYDDFSTNTIGTKWDEIVTGGTSKLVITNGVLEIDNDGSYRAIAKTKQEFGRDIVIVVRAKKVENIEVYWCWNNTSLYSQYGVPESAYTLMYRSWLSPTDLALRYHDSSGAWYDLDTYTISLDTNWHTYKIVVTDNNMTVYMDGSEILSGSDTSLAKGYIALSGREQPAGVTAEYDWIYVYKYIDPANYTVTIGSPSMFASFVLPVAITTSLASPVYNYSLRLELNSSNTQYWDTVFASDNLFVLDQNGHPLYYYIESYDKTNEDIVLWVNITLTNQTIYIYTLPRYNLYKSYDTPYRTFLFYDDFTNGINTNIWEGNTASFTASNGIISTSSSGVGIIAKNLNFQNVAVDSRVKLDTGARGNIKVYVDPSDLANAPNYPSIKSYDLNCRYPNGDIRLRYWAGNGATEVDLVDVSYTWDTNWHIWTIAVYNGDIIGYIDYKKVAEAHDTNLVSGSIGLGSDAIDSGSIYFDWIRVRKYVPPQDYSTTAERPIVIGASFVVPVHISTTLSSPVTDYSLRLEFNTTTYSYWDQVFSNGDNTTLYIIDSNGQPLYYWVEKYDTTNKDVILWVNTTLTNTTILVFTGATYNPYLDYQDPHRVFLWYDTQGDPSKYSISQITGTATWSQDTTTGNPAPSLKATWSSNGEQIAYPPSINLTDVVIEADMKGSSYSVNVQPTIGVRYIAGQGIIEFRIHPNGATGTSAGIDYKDISSNTDNFLWSTSSFTLDTSVWYHVVGIAYGNKVRMLVYANGNLLADSGWVSTTWTSSGYAGAVYVDGTSGTSIWWDNIIIRKYVDPSNYTVSYSLPLGQEVYAGYGGISPSSIFGVLSSLNGYTYCVNFTVWVTNNGTVPQNYTLLVLTPSGSAVYNKTVYVNAGSTYTTWFTYTWTSPVNTTWYYVVEANTTVYTNITIPVNIVEVIGAYAPIHISTTLSSPVPNYTLMLNLTSSNFNGWSYIGGSNTIAFIDSNGNPLYFWVKELNTTIREAIIYVNVTLTNTTIYMYVNLDPNPLLSFNNPYRTFLLYDDFNSKDDQWVWNSDWTVTNGYAEATVTDTWNNALYSKSINVEVTSTVGVSITTYAKNLGTVSAYDMQIGWNYDNTVGAVSCAVGSFDHWETAGTWGSTTDWGEPDERNWNTYNVILYDGTWKIYINGKLYSTNNANMHLLQDIYIKSKGQSYWDYVIVQRYVDPSTYSVSIGSLVGVAGVVFTGSITPTNVTVAIPSVNATAYQVFNMTVQNIGNETGWAIMELIGDNNTVLYSNNVTLASGQSYSDTYNATFNYTDHGVHVWHYIVKNDTKTFVNQTVTITVVINITLSFNYTQYFNQSVFPSWVNSTWFNYTISIPEPAVLEKWIPALWYNYTQSANAVLNSVTWIQANNVPRIIGANACLTIYTNTTGNWTQAYHVCNAYAYYLVVEFVLEPEGVPADYPNAYVTILVWDNSANTYKYIYSIYVPSGNQSVLLFANQYYKLQIPVSGDTIHGYYFELDKYVLDYSLVNPPTIYLNQSHVLTIYYKITTQPTSTTTTPGGTTTPPPGGTITVPIVPPSLNYNYTFNGTGLLPTNIGWGSPGLYTAKGILLTVFYLGVFIIFLRLYDWKTALLVSTSLGMIVAIIMFGTALVPLFMVLLLIGVGLWKYKS